MPQLARYLLFTVDTEPDDPTWSGLNGGPWSHENLEGIHELASRMRALGVRPTYLLTHSVAKLGALEITLARDLSLGNCEVGVHFHPGDTPPFLKQKKGSNKSMDNILRLPTELLEEKFFNIHQEVLSRFGQPQSYRSAAWVMDSRVTGLLQKYKYKVDTSVTPGISWRWNGRPSYLSAPMRAYPLGLGDPAIPSFEKDRTEGTILEVPVSIWSAKNRGGTWVGNVFGDMLTMPMEMRDNLVARIVKHLRPTPPQWLRPAFKDAAHLAKVAMHLEEEGAEYLHVMCHSSELWPGSSPYVKDRAQMVAFYTRLEGIFRHALYRGYQPVTLAQFAAKHSETFT